MEKVTIGVHQRLDQAGFIVKVTVGEGDWQRVAKLPVEDRTEADALARSIKSYLDLGLPIEVFLPAEDDQPTVEEASNATL